MGASTKFISIPIFRNTEQIAALDDSLGYMSMRLATAKFLDIEQLAKTIVARIVKRKTSKNVDRTLVDGTKLATNPTGKDGAPGTNNESDVLADISIKGSKSIILVTGQETANKNNRRVSIRFPQFATNKVISDALGTIIPAAKIKVEPTASDIFPYFISPGGKRYPILTKAAASTLPDTRIPGIDVAIAELQSVLGDEIFEAAGE